MASAVSFCCDVHKDPFECPDALIFYKPNYDEYGIIIHDGPSYQNIGYCPWCGTKLGESKRDLWFDTLEELGFDEPFEQNIPKEFRSEEWWNCKKTKGIRN